MTRSFGRAGKLLPRSAAALMLALSFAIGANSGIADKASGPKPDAPTVEQDFRFHCAACHGADGKGGGPVARALKIEPPDLTRIAERNAGVFPGSMVFGTISGLNMPISHGTREMPVWGDMFVGEMLEGAVSVEDAQEAATDATDRIKRLVGYIEGLQIAK